MSVLKNLSKAFISNLVKTLEDKIYFAKRKYGNCMLFFPPVECKNHYLPLLRFKSVFYYKISKAGVPLDEISLLLISRDRIYDEIITESNTYDVIALKYSRRIYEENERFYLNIALEQSISSYDDCPYSWEDDISYSNNFFIYYKKYDISDLRGRWDAGPFYYEDKRDIICKNGNSSFREEECVICKDAIPNIMFYNCGHIVVCEGCNTSNLRECPLCKTPCQIKRKLDFTR